jgi:hypothetical protein
MANSGKLGPEVLGKYEWSILTLPTNAKSGVFLLNTSFEPPGISQTKVVLGAIELASWSLLILLLKIILNIWAALL